MGTIRKRLGNDERWWGAEIVLRLAGLALLGGSAATACAMYRLALYQPETPLEFMVALAAFACLTVGLALLIAGPGLFKLVQQPPRALLP